MHQIKRGPKGELTLRSRTSVISHGSKGELALRGTFFIWNLRPKLSKIMILNIKVTP